ncbi:hypothetical protein DPX16_21512 [Anabarilius grahami]|uniref:Uncharacterized protein n=1 Tax=Anabarilius grahami TaxID=495550 RepID=A0A3N0XUU5_ANAGA|nr:hypothetical protein DPX16_21512 [Anabarilius grahami]
MVFSLTLFKPESTLMERLRKKLQLLDCIWTFLNGERAAVSPQRKRDPPGHLGTTAKAIRACWIRSVNESGQCEDVHLSIQRMCITVRAVCHTRGLIFCQPKEPVHVHRHRTYVWMNMGVCLHVCDYNDCGFVKSHKTKQADLPCGKFYR